MDPTTTQPPSPENTPPSPPPPQPPPQNPHTPTDAITEASVSDWFQNDEPSTSRNFKSLVFNLAGRLLPAHQSLIDRRFADILPHKLLVPDHPPYADMILTALWELKAKGDSSEEEISNFIKNEYHKLPWAHATILNHHLRDLCIKRKINMTRGRCYTLCSSIIKTEPSSSPSPSPSPSSSSPLSSAYSSSSSPSSSSSSQSWCGSNRTRKRKKIKKRNGKMVRVRGRGRGRGRGWGRGRVEERNKFVKPEQVIEDRNEVTVMEVVNYENKDEDLVDEIIKSSEENNILCEENNKEQYEPIKEEGETDIINVRSDDDATVLKVDVSDAKVDEHVEQMEQKEENNKNQCQPLKEEGETDIVNVRFDDDVTVLGDDVSNARVDEHVEQLEKKEENNLPCEQNNKNQCQPIKEGETDIVNVRFDVDVSDARVDEHEQLEKKEENNLPCEQNNKNQCEPGKEEAEINIVNVLFDDDVTVLEADVSNAKVDEHVEQLELKEENNLLCEENNKNQCQPGKEEAEINIVNVLFDDEVTVLEADVSDTKVDEHVEQLELKEEKEDTVMEHNQQEEIQQLNLVERQINDEKQVINDENLSEKQDSVIDCLTEEHEETKEQSADTHDDDDDDDDVIGEQVHPQDQCVEKIEESTQSCEQDPVKNVELESAEHEDEQQTEVNQKEIVLDEVQQEQSIEMIEQQTEISEKDSLQEKNNTVTNEQNVTSSSGTIEETRRPSRPWLRSSSKKEVAVSNCKKKLDLVTPVRRILRSQKTASESAVTTEVPDNSKEQVTHLGRTRSSKRKLEIAEAEQVSNIRKTRRTGL